MEPPAPSRAPRRGLPRALARAWRGGALVCSWWTAFGVYHVHASQRHAAWRALHCRKQGLLLSPSGVGLDPSEDRAVLGGRGGLANSR